MICNERRVITTSDDHSVMSPHRLSNLVVYIAVRSYYALYNVVAVSEHPPRIGPKRQAAWAQMERSLIQQFIIADAGDDILIFVSSSRRRRGLGRRRSTTTTPSAATETNYQRPVSHSKIAVPRKVSTNNTLPAKILPPGGRLGGTDFYR